MTDVGQIGRNTQNRIVKLFAEKLGYDYLGDWQDVFPGQVIGGAILDRLAHNAHQITLKGESVRKKLRLKNNQFLPLEPHVKTTKIESLNSEKRWGILVTLDTPATFL